MLFGTLRSQHSDPRSLGVGDRCLHGTLQISFRLQPVVNVVAMLRSALALLPQKVFSDRFGNLSRSRPFDPEVVEPWKFLRFRVREYRGKPLHC
jgi:hypothetical protein